MLVQYLQFLKFLSHPKNGIPLCCRQLSAILLVPSHSQWAANTAILLPLCPQLTLSMGSISKVDSSTWRPLCCIVLAWARLNRFCSNGAPPPTWIRIQWRGTQFFLKPILTDRIQRPPIYAGRLPPSAQGLRSVTCRVPRTARTALAGSQASAAAERSGFKPWQTLSQVIGTVTALPPSPGTRSRTLGDLQLETWGLLDRDQSDLKRQPGDSECSSWVQVRSTLAWGWKSPSPSRDGLPVPAAAASSRGGADLREAVPCGLQPASVQWLWSVSRNLKPGPAIQTWDNLTLKKGRKLHPPFKLSISASPRQPPGSSRTRIGKRRRDRTSGQLGFEGKRRRVVTGH